MKAFLTLGLVVVVTAFAVGCGSEEETPNEAQDDVEAVDVKVDPPTSRDVMLKTTGKRSEIKDAHDR